MQGGSIDARHAFANALAEELSGDEMLREVDHRLKSDFFVEHALYYLDASEMDELGQRVQAWQHYEFCSAAPDLCVEDPDPRAPRALQDFIDDKRASVNTQLGERTGFTDYYEREGIDALVVFLRPNGSSADLVFADAVSQRMRERVGEVFAREGPWTGSDMRFNLVGPYINKAAERRVIQRDMLRTGLFALGGVVLVLIVLFRSTRAVLTLLIPLTCGVAWSLGATQLALGHLNAITSMISSVVMGIGIDAGIHLLARARREREDYDSHDSIRRAFKGLIAPLLIASGTTASAFVVMATSEFPAFGEFGIIAAFGVALCLLAMITVYPALLAVVGVKKAKRLPPGGISQATRILLARPGLIFVAVVILTVASVRGVNAMRHDGFERSSRPLQSDVTREQTEADVFLISDIFGRDVHASVLAISDWDQLEEIYAVARARHAAAAEEGQTRVAGLVGAPSLLPSKDIDLQKRQKQIRALTANWSDRTWSRLEGGVEGNLPDKPKPANDDWDDPGAGDWGEFEPYQGDDDGKGGDGKGTTTDSGSDSGSADSGADSDSGSDGADDFGGDWGEFEPYEGGTTGEESAGDTSTGGEDSTGGDSDSTGSDTGEPTDGADTGGGEPANDKPTNDEPKEQPSTQEGLSPEDGKILRRMLQAQPFGPDDLPASAVGKLRGDDGSWGIFAYPNYDAADILTGVEFMEETAHYTEGAGIYVGEPTVYATIFTILEQEWPVVIGMAALIVSAFVFWQVRGLGQMLITLSPLLLAIWWTFGILGTFDLKLSLFNVPILPAILGIGVDN
ncbi:MAG: MMPL family transporter, partial [Myxococcales bacterium]|nr:MMPL family transporter [Myxococcales bacterium]